MEDKQQVKYNITDAVRTSISLIAFCDAITSDGSEPEFVSTDVCATDIKELSEYILSHSDERLAAVSFGGIDYISLSEVGDMLSEKIYGEISYWRDNQTKKFNPCDISECMSIVNKQLTFALRRICNMPFFGMAAKPYLNSLEVITAIFDVKQTLGLYGLLKDEIKKDCSETQGLHNNGKFKHFYELTANVELNKITRWLESYLKRECKTPQEKTDRNKRFCAALSIAVTEGWLTDSPSYNALKEYFKTLPFSSQSYYNYKNGTTPITNAIKTKVTEDACKYCLKTKSS